MVSNELDVNISEKKIFFLIFLIENVTFLNYKKDNENSTSVHMIKTHELLHSLSKNVSETGVLKKLFAKAHKRTKVLETPLPKNVTEKSQRIATYMEDKKEVSKWDPVVKKNRRVWENFNNIKLNRLLNNSSKRLVLIKSAEKTARVRGLGSSFRFVKASGKQFRKFFELYSFKMEK